MTRLSFRRVGAMVLRHLYILRGSWPRVLEMAYWPAVNMVVWGFTSQFFASHSSWVAQAGGVLIGAVILWDVMFRGNLGVSLSFLEEMWSRNLGHLSVSPLRPHELVAALLTMSLIRTVIGVMPAALLAIPLYHFSLFDLGLPLVAFWTNLMMSGWAIGLGVSALVLRFGMGAESLAWVLIFAVAPLAGIYYPIATLPGWLQPLAWALPPAHVFEGMRGVLFGHGFDAGLLASAFALNVFYLAAAVALFLHTHHVARRRGLLLSPGE
jgi:ABC-type multidrug transport system, permease component